MIKTYPFDDKTQLSAHFNVSEFRCKCGKAHDTLLADELVDKLILAEQTKLMEQQ